MPTISLGHYIRAAAAATTLMLVLVQPAVAQFESFVEKVTDINIFASCWSTRAHLDSKGCPSQNGYGVEVLWNLGSFPTDRGSQVFKPKTVTVRYTRLEKPGPPVGDSITVAVDSVVEYEVITPSTPAKKAILLELALGYSQFSGFGSEDDRYDLDGTVRELPSITLYASFPDRFPVVTPYIGLRTGLIELRNGQLYNHLAADTVATYSGAAQAFQLGLALGGAVPTFVPRTQLTVELSYHVRRFPSVQWAKDGAKTLDYFPRVLDFSGLSFSIGAQITLREKP